MSSAKPRAVVFTAPGTVEIHPQQVMPGDGEVTVSATVCGISHGTEMLFYTGPFPAGSDLETLGNLAETDYPIKYGYMTVGKTLDGLRVFAFYPHQSVFSVPAESLVAVPDSIPDDDAIFLPSVETALQIVHDAAPRLGETVIVFGLGMIGTLVSLLLDRMDLTVVAADPVATRRQRVEELGIVTLDPSRPGADRKVISATGRPDIAINTSGSGEALQVAVDLLRPEGTVVEASWFGSKPVTLQLGAAFHRRRLTLRASQVSHLNPGMRPRWDHARRTETVLRLIEDLAPSRFITHRFALDDAAQAYQMIHDHPDQVLQVVLDC